MLLVESYVPYLRVVNKEYANVAQSLSVWHQRLGHVCNKRIMNMRNLGIVKGLDITEENNNHICDACHFGKQTANVHPSRSEFRKHLPGE